MNTFYKNCAVPLCKSTSISTPHKLFINVPKSAQIRKKWLTLAKRHPASLSPTSTSYFCEDHFDLPNDMENYVQYKTMGLVGRIRMRPGCLPTKFACHIPSVNTSSDDCQPADAKRQRLDECTEEIRAAEFQQNENLNEVSSEDQDALLSEHQQQKKKMNKAVQINIRPKYRSKTTQTEIKTRTEQTSPIKFSSTSISTSPFKEPLTKPQLLRSITTCNLSDDKSDNHISSLFSPSALVISRTSSDASSLNDELKKVANSKCMVDNTVDKIMKKPQFYIGVPKDCYKLIKIIHEHTGISENKILLCLKKIRLHSKFSELSDEFEISKSYACKIFTENISKIAQVMKPFIVNLEKSAIKRCLPIAFRKKYYNVTCLINCLEVEIQKPSKPLFQSLTWSEYKKANTIKYLISSTPNGLVNYISQGYGGRISDVCLVENCDFLKCLPSGAHVMADGGFKHVEPLLLRVGCKLIRPSSIVSGNKFSKEEDEETKQNASLRIHIERVIRRIREFSFLKPHACINNYLLGHLDDVVTIACGLINLQNSLVNK